MVVKNIRLAVVLADADSTAPHIAVALVSRLQSIFPSLPILLISPRSGGVSCAWATFEYAEIASMIDADQVDWREHLPHRPSDSELPF